jgi:hypothetical protein
MPPLVRAQPPGRPPSRLAPTPPAQATCAAAATPGAPARWRWAAGSRRGRRAGRAACWAQAGGGRVHGRQLAAALCPKPPGAARTPHRLTPPRPTTSHLPASVPRPRLPPSLPPARPPARPPVQPLPPKPHHPFRSRRTAQRASAARSHPRPSKAPGDPRATAAEAAPARRGRPMRPRAAGVCSSAWPRPCLRAPCPPPPESSHCRRPFSVLLLAVFFGWTVDLSNAALPPSV